jgi:hypothetical protein
MSKEYIKNALELIFYGFAIATAYNVLTHFGIINEVHFGWYLLAGFIAFFGGDYLIEIHERWLLKRKIMKLAREVAKYEGIDPKSLSFDDIKISIDEEGYMEVEIQVNKQGEEKK